MPCSALPVLAFGFSSPLLLSGLALASIPFVIHLLHRRRHVETQWAAMRFLLAATSKQSRRMRLQNLILLLVRTLALILIVLALARPHFDAGARIPGSKQPTHRVLVIDSTFSMQRTGASGFEESDFAETAGSRPDTRFSQARKTALSIVQNSVRGDAWNLIRISDETEQTVIQTPAFRMTMVEEEIQSLAVSNASGDLPAALDATLQAVEQLPEIPRKEVVFITDLQASMWAPAIPESAALLKSKLEQIGKRARVSFLDVGGVADSNGAVTGLKSDSGVVTAKQAVRFQSTVRNFGQVSLRDQTIEFLVDGRLIETRRVDLPPGIDTPLDWEHAFLVAGDHSVEVHLQDDALPVDNRRWISVPVREQLNVLLVNGRPAGRPQDTATFYVERALAPSVPGDAWPGTIRPHTIGESELPSAALSRYDVVMLCDVGLITGREAAVLESYVRSGGGLIVLPGTATRSDSYNTHLYRDGEGILPAALGPLSGSQDQPLTFDPREFSHPLISAFRGNRNSGLESTLTFQFLQLTPAVDSRTALWFSDSSPALVEKQTGAGRVVLAATSADSRWSTWAIWAPSFVPMMHELVLFSASGGSRNRHLTVGEPIAISLEPRLFDLDVRVLRPDGGESVIPLNDAGHTLSGLYAGTAHPGVYQIRYGSPQDRTEICTVNVAELESDLKVTRQPVQPGEMISDVSISRRSAGDPSANPIPSEGEPSLSALSRILAWTVLFTLLLEPLLAWRFSWGIAAFACTAAIAILAPTLGWLLTGVIVTAGFATAIWRFGLVPNVRWRSVADD